MIKPLVSIIIPVYNAEFYLSYCLNSIIAQTYPNWECILIDDGSSDKSGSICDDYASTDNRFIVVHKENGGVSSARNVGVQNANSEWITFVDADDFVREEYLEGLLYPLFEDEAIDFIQGGCTNYDSGEKTINQSYSEYVGGDKLQVFNEVRGLIVSKLFKKKILIENGLSFDERMSLAEDMVFTMDYILHIDKYAFVPETGYYYRRDNNASATHKGNRSSFQELRHSFQHLYNSTFSYAKKYGIIDKDSPLRYQQQALTYYTMICSIYSDQSLEHDRKKRLAILREESSSEYSFLINYVPIHKKNFFMVKLIQNECFILFDFFQKTRALIKHND